MTTDDSDSRATTTLGGETRSQLTVIAKYEIRDGEVPRVTELIRDLVAATRLEPGNIAYDAYRSFEDDRSVVLVERYESAEAFDEHRASEHFQRLAVGSIIPLLVSRKVDTFQTDQPT